MTSPKRTLALLAAFALGCSEDGDAAGRALDASMPTRDSGQTAQDASDTPMPDAATVADAASVDASPKGDAGPEQHCVVFLHGKSGRGFATQNKPGFLFVGPTGNADGWGGKQWIYFPDQRLSEVQQILTKAMDDAKCTHVIVHGFSNGAAAAANSTAVVSTSVGASSATSWTTPCRTMAPMPAYPRAATS